MELIYSIASGCVSSVVTLAAVVIPIMVVLQLARDYQLMERIMWWLNPVSRLLGVSKQAGLPLMIGFAFGLAYGAGVIVQTAKEGNLSMRDRFLVIFFLVACHAIVEDTLVFVAVGANGWMLLSIRTGVAFIVTAVASRYLPERVIRGITVEEK